VPNFRAFEYCGRDATWDPEWTLAGNGVVVGHVKILWLSKQIDH
jgi:hypothetical protein